MNVDPDGVSSFGDEKWVIAQNQTGLNGMSDFWTNSRNEEFYIEYIATLTGGQTSQSFCENNFEFITELEPTVVSPPEAVPGAAGWWWYVIQFPERAEVLYEGCFVQTPQGFSVELRLNGGDIGRTRAASVLSTVKLL